MTSAHRDLIDIETEILRLNDVIHGKFIIAVLPREIVLHRVDQDTLEIDLAGKRTAENDILVENPSLLMDAGAHMNIDDLMVMDPVIMECTPRIITDITPLRRSNTEESITGDMAITGTLPLRLMNTEDHITADMAITGILADIILPITVTDTTDIITTRATVGADITGITLPDIPTRTMVTGDPTITATSVDITSRHSIMAVSEVIMVHITMAGITATVITTSDTGPADLHSVMVAIIGPDRWGHGLYTDRHLRDSTLTAMERSQKTKS